jgi:hypothetical protein
VTPTLTLALIAAYFAFVLGSLILRGREISGPWWYLLRSFFPNWRFYHGFGSQPRLFIRSQAPDGEWTEWQMFMPRAKFAVRDLFHNPHNNLLLANQNLVDHLAFDIQTLPDKKNVTELVSYQMVMRLVHSLVQQQSVGSVIGAVGAGAVTGLSGYRWQFRVLQVPPLQTPDDSMTILLSPELQS